MIYDFPLVTGGPRLDSRENIQCLEKRESKCLRPSTWFGNFTIGQGWRVKKQIRNALIIQEPLK